jgi:allophanate hydrolase
MPLNYQLAEHGARLAGAARTAPLYRLYALEGKPGLVRMPESGARIDVEVWEMSAAAFGSFVALVPPPLGIGTLQLESGEQVKGFLCEHYAVRDRADITSHGGWRQFLAGIK